MRLFYNTASNVTRFHMAYKMDIKRSFFHLPFLTILKPLKRSEIMFSLIKTVVKMPFLLYDIPPWWSCFAKIKVSCQTFKMDIERSLFFYPTIFDHFKATGKVRHDDFSLEKWVKKPFFSIQPPPMRSCFAKIRVSCDTFKMDIERSCFYPPIFDHFKTTGKVRHDDFSSKEG